MLYHRGEPARALAVLDEAIALAPDHADAHFICGFVLGELGRPADAATATARALALNPALVWFVRRRRPSFTASVDIGSECGRRFVVSVTEFERRCRCCWGWFLPPLWAGRGTTLPEKEG